MNTDEDDVIEVPCRFIIERAGEEIGLGPQGEHRTTVRMPRRVAERLTQKQTAEVHS